MIFLLKWIFQYPLSVISSMTYQLLAEGPLLYCEVRCKASNLLVNPAGNHAAIS